MNNTDPQTAYRQPIMHSGSLPDVFIQAYDLVASVLYSAARAMEARNIEKKTADVNRALTIVMYLQAALDFENGGEVAATLNQFYKIIRKEIFDGSARLNAELLRQAAAHVIQVRNVWEKAQSLVRVADAGAASASLSNASSVRTNFSTPPADVSLHETSSPSSSWTA